MQDIEKMLVVAWGNLGQRKLAPALSQLARQQLISQVAVCETRDVCPEIDGQPVPVYRICDSLLPLDELDSAGLLGQRTLAYLACPGQYRGHYAAVLAPHVRRVAAEKPLDLSRTAALGILSLPNVFPVIHSLFKEPIYSLAAAGWRTPQLPEQWQRRLVALELHFAESSPASSMLREDAFTAMGIHPQSLLQWLAVTCLCAREIKVEDVLAATYLPDAQSRPTATLVTGCIDGGDRIVPYMYVAGWGLPNHKAIYLHLSESERAELAWNESGWAAHYRLLRELLCRQPDMRLSAADSVRALELSLRARDAASASIRYDFGEFPTQFRSRAKHWLSQFRAKRPRTKEESLCLRLT